MIGFPYALDGEKTVYIDNAKLGKEYTCLECKEPMIPRMGEINRYHFAHKANPDALCTPESVLHLAAKTVLASYIQKMIERKATIPVKWACYDCWGTHKGNLARKARIVEVEKN